MTDTIHLLVEKYGLIAIFFGCIAEGESFAILAGFFSHQALFAPWQAFCAAFLGAFVGDTLFFLLGRHFSRNRIVLRLRRKPGFSHALRLVQAHPNLFVLSNRFIYGLRLVGGVAAGFSQIGLARFTVLNALSSAVWAALFCALGYVFGLGAEQIMGDELKAHHRLLVGLGIGLAVALAGWLVARHVAAKEPREGES